MSWTSKKKTPVPAEDRLASIPPAEYRQPGGVDPGRQRCDSPRWPKSLLPPILILLAGLLVYSNSFRGEFIHDDELAIRKNVTIRRLWPLSRVIFPSNDLLMVEGNTVQGRPLLNLSFALNYAAGGLDVRGYHAVNLTVHLVAGLLLYGVVRRTLLLPKFRKRMEGAATWLALIVALVWVVHPLQTESVTYMAQRAESLMGLCFLLTLYLAIRGFDSVHPPWWRIAAVVACVLGMTAKEVMVTAPLMVLLFDWFFVAEDWRQLWRQRWKFHLSLCLLGWGTLAAVMIGTQGSNLANVQALYLQLSGRDEGIWEAHDLHWTYYARQQPWALTRYLFLSLWPNPLVFAYLKDVAHGTWEIVLLALLVGLILTCVIVASLRRHWTGFVGLWFFLILAPTSSVVPLSSQTVAEHRMYLSLAAVVVLVVMGVFAGWNELRARAPKSAREGSMASRIAGAAAAILVLSVFGALTAMRNADYRDSVSIWRDTLSKWPADAAVRDRLAVSATRNNLALALFQQDRVDEAMLELQKALEVDDLSSHSHYNFALVLVKAGKLDEAIIHFQRAVELSPGRSDASNNLGEALMQSGKVNEAVEQFQKAIASDPLNVAADNNLGNALFQQGRLSEAIPHYERALQVDPESATAHSNLGNVLLRSGKVDEAIAHYEKALEVRPNFVDAHNNLAAAYQQEGRLKEALAHLEEAVKESPRALGVRNNLALFLATIDDASLRDGARAVELAQGVNRDSGGNRPGFLHTLAAAYAEAGKFIEADETAERAQSLAAAQGDRIQAEVLRRARRLYQAGKPLRHSSGAGAP